MRLPAGPLLLNVKRLHPLADHATLLRAMAEVLRARRDVTLLIAGTGEEEAALQAAGRAARPRRRRCGSSASSPTTRSRSSRAAPTCSCSRRCWRRRPRWPSRRWPAARRSSPPTTRAGSSCAEIFGDDVEVVPKQDPPALAEAILRLPGRRPADAPAQRREHRGALPPPRGGGPLPRALPGGGRRLRAIDNARHRAPRRRRASAASTTTRSSSTCAARRSSRPWSARARGSAGRVLDAGCGGGGTALSLAEESAFAVGLDLEARFVGSGTRLGRGEGRRERGLRPGRRGAPAVPGRDLRRRLQPLRDRARDLGHRLPARVPPRAAAGRRPLPLHRALLSPWPARTCRACSCPCRCTSSSAGGAPSPPSAAWPAARPGCCRSRRRPTPSSPSPSRARRSRTTCCSGSRCRVLVGLDPRRRLPAAARGPPRHRLLPPRPARPRCGARWSARAWAQDVMIGHIQCVLEKP